MTPSIKAKLDAINERHEEIAALLGDAEVISNQNQFRDLSKEYSRVEPIVKLFSDYQSIDEDIAKLKGLFSLDELVENTKLDFTWKGKTLTVAMNVKELGAIDDVIEEIMDAEDVELAEAWDIFSSGGWDMFTVDSGNHAMVSYEVFINEVDPNSGLYAKATEVTEEEIDDDDGDGWATFKYAR